MYRLLTRLHPTHIIAVYKIHVVKHATSFYCCMLPIWCQWEDTDTLLSVWGGDMMCMNGVLAYETSHTKGWVSRMSLQPPSTSH